MRKKIFSLMTSVLLLSGSVALPVSAQQQDVSYRTVKDTLTLEGVVEAINQSTVSAHTAGTIVELPVDVDDAVAADQLIVRLEDTEQTARLKRAQANLESAQATLNDATKRFQRVSELYQQEVASASERDDAKTLFETSKARVADAKAALAEAQKQLSYTRVKAPYAGIVTERFVELGESVQPGQPLMSGLSLEHLRVITELPQQYAQYVRNSRSADIVTDDGRQLAIGSMTFYPYADAQTHTFRLRLNLTDPEGRLFPGVLVKVKVAVGEREVMLVPHSAVVVRGELRAVYVVKEDGEAQLRQVRVGQNINGQLEILAGLVPGEQILTATEAMLND